MHGKSSIFQEWTLYPSDFDVFNQHSHSFGWNLVLLLQADIGRTELGIGGWYSSKEWNVGLYGHTWRQRPCSGAQALGCKLGNNPSLKMKLKCLWKKQQFQNSHLNELDTCIYWIWSAHMQDDNTLHIIWLYIWGDTGYNAYLSFRWTSRVIRVEATNFEMGKLEKYLLASEVSICFSSRLLFLKMLIIFPCIQSVQSSAVFGRDFPPTLGWCLWRFFFFSVPEDQAKL